MKGLALIALLAILVNIACIGLPAASAGTVKGAAPAAQAPETSEKPKGDKKYAFDGSFDTEGYTGEWTAIGDLELEFFLPEGWKADEAPEDAAFSGGSADGSATLAIALCGEAYDAADMEAWAEANIEGEYEMVKAGDRQYAVQTGEVPGPVTVYVPCSEGRVAAFRFTRQSEDALSAAFALSVAATVTDSWD